LSKQRSNSFKKGKISPLWDGKTIKRILEFIDIKTAVNNTDWQKVKEVSL
jgi:hypothetical protein